MARAKIGIIGGSGLYRMKGISDVEEIRVTTPFGEPSDSITLGNIEGTRVAFLPRHGKGHRISPSELPARANIYALKSLGVERIISLSAVGSLREDIEPLHFVIPDQIIDRTKSRKGTFFTEGIVCHVTLAHPFCPDLSQTLYEATLQEGFRVHKGGTYVAIEGPNFSTIAESQLYRSWNADILGMTAFPEANLAREAEMCYATLAFVSDYDCWHPEYEKVTTEMILSNLKTSVDASRKILRRVIPLIGEERKCICATALKNAIATSPDCISERVKRDLGPIIGKYIKGNENAS